MRNNVKIVHKGLENMLVNFFAVSGFSWGLDLKSSSTELTMAYQVDLGVERRRKCDELRRIWSSDIPLYQPWRGDN